MKILLKFTIFIAMVPIWCLLVLVFLVLLAYCMPSQDSISETPEARRSRNTFLEDGRSLATTRQTDEEIELINMAPQQENNL